MCLSPQQLAAQLSLQKGTVKTTHLVPADPSQWTWAKTCPQVALERWAVPRAQDQLACVSLGGMSTTATLTGAQPLSHNPHPQLPKPKSSENHKALTKFSANSFGSET